METDPDWATGLALTLGRRSSDARAARLYAREVVSINMINVSRAFDFLYQNPTAGRGIASFYILVVAFTYTLSLLCLAKARLAATAESRT